MMIEVSITEIALFAWAIIATGYAFKFKQEAQMGKRFVQALLEDEELRNRLITEYKEVQNAN
jgi:hypothetical protein